MALMVVGPKQLPDIAKSLGRGLAEFTRTADEFQRTMLADVSHETSPRILSRARAAQAERRALSAPKTG